MDQQSVNPAIGSILDEQKLKNIVYPARLFRARLNEEFLRANRTCKPFLYIKIYAHQYDFFGWGSPNQTVENTWRISILTMFSHLRFIDVLGYLPDGNGLGIILLNSDMSTLESIRKEILHKLNDAGLIQSLRIKPRKPIFEAHLYMGSQEKNNLEMQAKLDEFNSTNGSFFSLQRLNLDHIWQHPHRIRFRHIIKRIVDVVCTSAAIVLCSPLLLFCAAAVKISDPKGPVIFKQVRTQEGTDEAERNRRQDLQDEERPENLPLRQSSPQVQPRRTASVLQHHQGRHEYRRSATAYSLGSG